MKTERLEQIQIRTPPLALVAWCERLYDPTFTGFHLQQMKGWLNLCGVEDFLPEDLKKAIDDCGFFLNVDSGFEEFQITSDGISSAARAHVDAPEITAFILKKIRPVPSGSPADSPVEQNPDPTTTLGNTLKKSEQKPELVPEPILAADNSLQNEASTTSGPAPAETYVGLSLVDRRKKRLKLIKQRSLAIAAVAYYLTSDRQKTYFKLNLMKKEFETYGLDSYGVEDFRVAEREGLIRNTGFLKWNLDTASISKIKAALGEK